MGAALDWTIDWFDIYGLPLGLLNVNELPPSEFVLTSLDWWDDLALRPAAAD